METKMVKCPYCGQLFKHSNPHHTKKCLTEYIKNLTEEQKEDFRKSYIDDGLSLPDMVKKYSLPYSHLQKILPAIGITLRNLKQAANMSGKKEKYEKSMMEHFGCKHNFMRECSSRKEWEDRLLKEEGITNVFQRKEVIEKIKETMLERYGEDGIYYNRVKGSTLEYWIDKLGEEKGIEHFNEICYEKGKANKYEYYIETYGEEEGLRRWKKKIYDCSKWTYNNGLNDTCAKLLDKNNIIYEREFKILKDNGRFYSYDFKIQNLLIELNGTYWHCSPKRYQPNDLVRFPNNHFILAKDKWEYDKQKCLYAESKGYKIISIWEDEFNEEKLLEILKKYNYGSC